MWKVTYDNDTGPEDDYFIEWYCIVNDELGIYFRIDDRDSKNADRLCALLNEHWKD